MKLAEDYSFEDEASTIVEPMNAATPIAKPTSRPSILAQKGIVISEPLPQAQPEKQTEVETSNEEEDLEYKRA